MSTEKKGKSEKIMKYGMYAGAGLLLGVLAYYGYKKYSSKTSAAAPGASSSSNASGHRHGHHKHVAGHHHASGTTAASWDCKNHPDHPGCNPTVEARSWDCQHHPEKPGCNPMLTNKVKMSSSKQAGATQWGA